MWLADAGFPLADMLHEGDVNRHDDEVFAHRTDEGGVEDGVAGRPAVEADDLSVRAYELEERQFLADEADGQQVVSGWALLHSDDRAAHARAS